MPKRAEMPERARTPVPILITRPAAQADRFAQACRDAFSARARPVISPLLQINLKPPQPIPAQTHLIFTSENAVAAYAQSKGTRGHVAYCVGDRTAKAARAAGCKAHSAQGAAAELVAMIEAASPDARLVYLRGAEVRRDIAQDLRAKGFGADSFVVYAQVPIDLTAEAQALLAQPAPVIVPLFSPRSAQLFSETAATAQAPLLIAALSEQVAQAITIRTQRLEIAAKPDAECLVKAIAKLLGDKFG